LSFNICVLSVGNWPQYKEKMQRELVPTLPRQLEAAKGLFTQWYHSRNSSRTLKWLLTLGEVSLSGAFRSGTYDFQLNTLQVCYSYSVHNMHYALCNTVA
jgi:Cullin family